MATKAIKGVDEDAWNILKSFAVREGVSMGAYLNELAKGLEEKKADAGWDKILSWKAKDPKETSGMAKRISEFRKGFGLREFK